MPRDYQAWKNNPYRLPDVLYRRTLATIRDYDRMKREINYAILASPGVDGPRGSGIGDPTARAAERIERMQSDVRAIERALEKIPPEYRKGVFNSVRYYRSFPVDADRTTYARHKQKFVYFVAENLGWM